MSDRRPQEIDTLALNKSTHLHLVSDASGEIVELVARAALAQLSSEEATKHLWNMVREQRQVEDVLEGIANEPGFVLHTVLEERPRRLLEDGCRRLGVPFLAVLPPVVEAFADYMNSEICYRPAGRHFRDADYLRRIEALRFIMAHDDGVQSQGLKDADVVLVGVSRTSKTPTCMILANRGLKAANVPFVPGCPLPDVLSDNPGLLIVALTMEPRLLTQLRVQRLTMLKETRPSTYSDPVAVTHEVAEARRTYARMGWPILDVSRKSIEETAATILQMVDRHRGGLP